MTIDLNGYGMFQMEESNFKRFLEICDMDSDLFLDMLIMHNKIGAIPILPLMLKKLKKKVLFLFPIIKQK